MFGPGWAVDRVDDIYEIKQRPGGDYHIWCSKAMVRNHAQVLEWIRDNRVEAGRAREWHRDGFVMAVDLVPHPHPTVSRHSILEARASGRAAAAPGASTSMAAAPGTAPPACTPRGTR